jgi:hypothetical protein
MPHSIARGLKTELSSGSLTEPHSGATFSSPSRQRTLKKVDLAPRGEVQSEWNFISPSDDSNFSSHAILLTPEHFATNIQRRANEKPQMF